MSLRKNLDPFLPVFQSLVFEIEERFEGNSWLLNLLTRIKTYCAGALSLNVFSQNTLLRLTRASQQPCLVPCGELNVVGCLASS